MLSQKIEFPAEQEHRLAVMREFGVRKGGLIRPSEGHLANLGNLRDARLRFLKKVEG